MKKTKTNLKEIHRNTLQVAYEAGEKLRFYRKRLDKLKVNSKKAQGVVSEADIETEKLIIRRLLDTYPKTEVLAEEMAFKKFKGDMKAYQLFKEREWTWIIDPLDGTSNFLSGLDIFAVCIALAHYGKPVVGVVYNPMSGECYSAIEDQGSWLSINRKRMNRLDIKNSSKKLSESMLATGFATEKGVTFDREFRQFKKMMEKCRAVRRMGSAAIDLCYVARGTFDGFWERGLAPWDVAAAGLICKEAGALVTDYSCREFHPFQETIVAAPSKLHPEILKVFK